MVESWTATLSATETELHQQQAADIWRHQLRVKGLVEVCLDSPLFNSIKKSKLAQSLRFAAGHHDDGKSLIGAEDYFVEKPTRKKLLQIFGRHPADSLKVLGETKVLADVNAAALIANHHPYGLDHVEKRVQAWLPNPLESEQLLGALLVLVGCDVFEAATGRIDRHDWSSLNPRQTRDALGAMFREQELTFKKTIPLAFPGAFIDFLAQGMPWFE